MKSEWYFNLKLNNEFIMIKKYLYTLFLLSLAYLLISSDDAKTIIAGITIGQNAMIGAGSVITEDVPDYGLVYGNPGKLKGFVCECGNRLKEEDRQEKCVIFCCPKCRTKISIDEIIFQRIE